MTDRMRKSSSMAVGLAALALLAGCGGGSSDTPVAAPDETAAPAATPVQSNFIDPREGTNKWLPLKPGTQWVREGTTMIGKRAVPHKVVSTVTDVMREIDGVKTLLVLDEETGAGQTVDKSVDYLAVDKDGNVWLMGGVTEQYQGGKSTGIDEAWLAGKAGSQSGMMVPADPTKDTKPWGIAQPPGEKGELAGFLKTAAKECVPFDCYKDVLVIEEGIKSKKEIEYKYYAAGVGQIRNEPKASHDLDVEKLINLTKLSASGLAEQSKEALRLDEAGAQDQKKTFGDVKAARVT
jgi:hypothetical protein